MSPYLYCYLLFELVVVSWGDVKSKRIPNSWALLNGATFILLAVFWPAEYAFSPSTLIYPLGLLVVGFFLFALNIMGGGDSKFLATFFLLVPGSRHQQFFIILLYGTILFSGALFCYHSLKNLRALQTMLWTRSWHQFSKIYGKKFSFSPTILFSWAVFGHIMGVWEEVANKGSQLLNTSFCSLLSSLC